MDARVIAATNRNLIREVRAERFREDLFYRLRTVPLNLPPLRERADDIPTLLNYFISRLNKKFGKNVRGIDPKVMAHFQRYRWPGNVRELLRTLEYAFVFVKGSVITQSHLPEMDDFSSPEVPEGKAPESGVWEEERVTLEKALKKAGGSRQKAAQLLGLSRSTLWRKMKTYGLS